MADILKKEIKEYKKTLKEKVVTEKELEKVKDKLLKKIEDKDKQ